MSQESEETVNDEMKPEYDFSGGVRGKYYEAYTQSSNVVILDPDVAEIFRDSASVNEALRLHGRKLPSLSRYNSLFQNYADESGD